MSKEEYVHQIVLNHCMKHPMAGDYQYGNFIDMPMISPIVEAACTAYDEMQKAIAAHKLPDIEP